MDWSSPDGWLTKLFSGDPLVILIAFLVTISLPVLVHIYFYSTSKRASITPTFLLLGPSGAGKTSLLNILQSPSAEEARDLSPTRVSQVSSSPIALTLPPSIAIGSNKYRSENDDSKLVSTPYKLRDTPGHGKLRVEHGLGPLSDPDLKGVIFMVDAASLDSSESTSLCDAATYLHDVLLRLQQRRTSKSSKSKDNSEIPVLVAANKQDLFTALPPGAVRDRLEAEIERVRRSRSRALVNVGGDAADEPEEGLGGDGEANFSFKLFRESYGIGVDVVGGAVGGEEAGKGVRRWEEWIGSCL